MPAWHAVAPPAPARNALVSLALRPAPVTDQWRAEGGALAPRLAAAADGLTWIEAPDQKREALAIALLLREAAETGIRAALVTPDRTLARRVAAELDRWGLIPDDSAGRPLALTPPGVLLRLVAALPGQPLTPEALLAILKHPLVASAPGGRGPHLRLVGRIETKELRGGPPWVRWDELADFAAARRDRGPGWLAWLRTTLEPLADSRPRAARRARRPASRHRRGAGGRADGGAHGLWGKAAGAEALALLEALAAEADAGGFVGRNEYRALFQSLIAARDVPEEAVVTHPGLAIWGTLEARVQAADRVILGGLNEGVWPRLPGADPWLDRGLRRQLGLPSPEAPGRPLGPRLPAGGRRARGGPRPRHARRRGADRGLALAASAREPARRPAAARPGRPRRRPRPRRRLARARRPARRAGGAAAARRAARRPARRRRRGRRGSRSPTSTS